MREERVRNRVHRGPLASPSRLRGDQGSIIAEAALLTPFFVTLLFGMLEFGGAFRDYLTVGTASQSGARSAAIQGNNATADWQILYAIEKASAAMPFSQIKSVVIYKGTASSTSPPGTCTTTSTCNTYTSADLTAMKACGTAPCGAWLTNTYPAETTWSSTSRNVLVNGPPDYVGVYITVVHPWITGLFGNNITLKSNTVAQIEPQKLSS